MRSPMPALHGMRVIVSKSDNMKLLILPLLMIF